MPFPLLSGQPSFLSSLPVAGDAYALFLGLMATFAITPGPANLFAVATGVSEGRKAALFGVLGMNAATLVWYGAAALGLGALVAAFPEQFHLLALAGAAYVGWLAFKALRSAWRGDEPPPDLHPAPRGAAFLRGFAVQIANPKAILFFTAVLPPFIDPARPLIGQLAMFAAAMLVLDMLAMSGYGLAGAGLAARLRQRRFRRGFNAVVGILLSIAAGLILLRA